ncbi:MAG TPA: radical SAM protein [Lachnospiraceae bacterium]|nr:radical SAM protein [Lachnospiraceae bacterium]
MNRDELYASIYTHDTIYLPPWEEGVPALEVALGCSWHKCRFCDFAKDPFQIHPMDKIEQNMKILGQLRPEATRLFLLGENAFVIPAEDLAHIFDMTDQYMPHVNEFSMYARIDDILRKSMEELHMLHQMGLTTLHIGVESGSNPILHMMNKGITAEQTVEALNRLDQVGIEYCLTVILGLGGRTFRNMHAIETARMLNRTHPKNIWCLKLKVWENTPLETMVKKGEFDPMTPEEILLEERLLLENLHVTNCLYVDTTVLDVYTIQGNLPQEKQSLLTAVNNLLRFNMPKMKK